MLPDGVTPPRRLLLTLDAVGGVWRYALDLAAELGGQGTSCLLAGFGPEPRPEQRAACARLSRVELVWTDAPLDWMVPDEAALQPMTAALIRLAREWKPDLLHLNLPSQAVGLPSDLAVVAASHSCVPTWWQAVRGDDLPPAWRWQWRRNKEGLDRAEIVLAPSVSHAAALRHVYGELPGLRVVYNAARISPAAVAHKQDLVLSVGRWWDDGKNGRVLDAAAASSPWPVLMAGPLQGPQGEMACFGHAHVTSAALPASKVLDVMRRAGIFAAPSRYEPFGLAVLEAALCGCALVLADIPTFRELWQGAAVFVSADDPAAWTAAFAALAANPARRRQLAALAQRRAETFTPQRQLGELVSLYAAAVSGNVAETKVVA
jgi:glycosyltransferase involved in cell wall biosynthesis